MECSIKTERCGGLCTGYDGSDVWKKRKQINDTITCESCKEEAAKLETFTHDIVNARLGKNIHDKKNWDNFIGIVNCSNDSCKKEGRC